MNFIGFYWTLPVPWAGFVDLPKDPDAAAAASKTIRYQVEYVRHWVKQEHGTMVAEKVFIERYSDRGSDKIIATINRMIQLATKKDAQLVLVDFAEAMQWRKHGLLWDRLNESGRYIALEPKPWTIEQAPLMKQEVFNPIDHFRTWRQLDTAHAALKPDARASLKAKIADLKALGATYAAIAMELNENGMPTVNGKPWTEDNVRKVLAQK